MEEYTRSCDERIASARTEIEKLTRRGGKADIVGVKGRTVKNVWGEEGCTFRNAVEIASMYNFTNRMSLACGMIPNEEYHALAR